jgi:hypothetical protein
VSFESWKDYFVSQGYPALITDPHRLEYDGAVLSVDGFPIDIIYKRVVIHEFLGEFGLDHPLVRAYRHLD